MFAWRALPASPDATPGAYLTVPALRSAGIRVAFTTRAGGSSTGEHRSLNLSLVAGDDPATVLANRGRALGALGAPAGAWTSGRQVHGAGVAAVAPADRGRGATDPADTFPDTDALWTDAPGVALAVLVADCVPILLADPERRRIAVVHAGWRGMVAGVIGNAVEALAAAPSLQAYVGPAIGPCCYEVGDDVAAHAASALGEAVVRRGARTRLDLWDGALTALRDAGVARVRRAALCTRCEPHRLFSHRAGHAGRQGLIAMISDA